ncbi:MAG: class I SAM-dependent methyltransferase [Bacteroidota bacterium]|nr:class I SAM-dependent methyltransferase [Candidatus Kapabacteria bacterium]MDW8220560.1 class I SAM-dependent methyltransferase [Bacteroidota bacterium]
MTASICVPRMCFPNHFSALAHKYVQYRPGYPDALFAFLASQVREPSCAWDCGTGNGQAALGLARHFHRVIATDASPEQLAVAIQHPNIEYRLAQAESSGLATASIDVCTVAQALHWFNLEKFYQEVRRVVRSGGILAVWAYAQSTVTPDVDAVISAIYRWLRPYFPPERRWIDEHYTTIPFPFPELSAPAFSMSALWTLEEMLGYYSSWSAIAAYQREHGHSPLPTIEHALRTVWTQPRMLVQWTLHLRIGRIV